MDKFFKLSERGTSVRTEAMSGFTTFLTMAYIIFVNPSILEAAGMSFSAALTATCFGAALMTIAMGLIANRPLALASGMGINAIVAYGLCLGLGVDWRVAMAVVMFEGLIILILVVAGLREAIMDAIPVDLRHAIGIGIGLFIALIGLLGSGIIVPSEATTVAMGSVTDPAALLGIIALVFAIVFTALDVKGGLLWSILLATLIGIPMGVTQIPEVWTFSGLDFSAFGAPFQSVDGTMAMVKVFTQPILLMYVFALLMSDFFDTMGTVVAVGTKANFADEDGNVEDIKPILLVDSVAAVAGGVMGASSVTTFVESTAGASEGARTGLSSIVVGLCFVVFAFLGPVVGMVSGSATCGALVVVGYLMMSEIGRISWNDITMAFPAFLTIAMIPFTYSITNGIGLGFISYCLIMAIKGRAKEVHILMWVSALAFLMNFILAA